MCLGDDNMHKIKRRKLVIPASSITEHSSLYYLQHRRWEGRSRPEQHGRTKRGKWNRQGCKFIEFSSMENMEMQLSDMLHLLSHFQLFGCMQEEMSWEKVLRSSITNRVQKKPPCALTIFEITRQFNFWIIIFKLSFSFPFSPDSSLWVEV